MRNASGLSCEYDLTRHALERFEIYPGHRLDVKRDLAGYYRLLVN